MDATEQQPLLLPHGVAVEHSPRASLLLALAGVPLLRSWQVQDSGAHGVKGSSLLPSRSPTVAAPAPLTFRSARENADGGPFDTCVGGGQSLVPLLPVTSVGTNPIHLGASSRGQGFHFSPRRLQRPGHVCPPSLQHHSSGHWRERWPSLPIHFRAHSQNAYLYCFPLYPRGQRNKWHFPRLNSNKKWHFTPLDTLNSPVQKVIV